MKVRPFWFHLCRLISLTFFKIFHGIRTRGADSIPEGPIILAPNHASYLDPPAVGCSLRRVTYYLARHTLFAPPVGSWLLPSIGSIPVNQQSPGPSSLKNIFEVLKNKGTLVLFPEGGRTLDGNLAKAEPGIGLIAARANVPVFPFTSLEAGKPCLGTEVGIRFAQSGWPMAHRCIFPETRKIGKIFKNLLMRS